VRRESVLLNGLFSCIHVPDKQHVSPNDGGHLLVLPFRHVPSRSYLKPHEIVEMTLLSILAADGLRAVLGAEWVNYQENGNWSLEHPEIQHLHLHIYGRARGGTVQRFGEALRFPLRAELDEWHIEQLSANQVKSLMEAIDANYHLPRWTAHRKAIEILAQQHLNSTPTTPSIEP
jgi:diadenosine tetraphosphate (Ap4A) HIT family hydrolase